MFSIGICDDNPGFLDLLKSLIEQEFKKVVSPKLDMFFSSFYSGESVLKHVENNKLDLLFLDIDMPVISGFELAKKLSNKKTDTLIVFMSAYDNFMYESFNFCPFAYLRKSTMLNDLKRVIGRVNDEILSPRKYITVTVNNKEIEIDVKKILCFESNKNYFIIHLVGGTDYVCRGTLSSIESKVEEFDFYKVHSAFLVNLEHSGRITEEHYLHIENMRVPIAQKRISDYRKVMSEFTRRKAGI